MSPPIIAEGRGSAKDLAFLERDSPVRNSMRRLALVIGLGLLAGLGCGPGGEKDPLVVRISEVVGSIEVAENQNVELRKVDSVHGLKLLTRGAAIKIPEGGRVRLEWLHKKGIIWVHGPADLEMTEARLVRGGAGGINDKIDEVHATWYLREGVFAGAMEGPQGGRPSIEVQTEEASVQFSPLGKFAVIRMPGKSGGEAWIRDRAGQKDQRILLLKSGKLVEFPPNGILYWSPEQELTPDLMDDGNRDFNDAFLTPLTVQPKAFPDLGHLLDEVNWKRIR
jgi:hypothetical protein